MKRKIIIFSLSGILLIGIFLIVIFYCLNNNNNNKSNTSSPEVKNVNFNEVYSTNDLQYNSTEDKFNLSVNIVNKTEEEQILTCIRVEIVNNEDKVMFSSEENLGIYLNKDEVYNYQLSFSQNINIDNIKEIKYNFCS